MAGYLDYSGRDDVLGGGARRIPVSTPKGTYHVWVKRTGNNPRLRVLLLHGGPGSTHEYLEACDSFLPAAGVEYYYYDQLGSGFSDQPDEPSLWELDRFVDEVEQVRQALGLDARQLRALRPVLGRHPRHGVRAAPPAAPARAGHLQHDGERPGLQRLRRAGADAGDGPGGAGRDQGARGGRRDRGPPVHGAADRAALRAPCAADAAGRLAGSGAARLRAHQPGDLRVHAGAQRAGHQRRRQARRTGTGSPISPRSRCRPWSSAPSTTRWTRPTWRRWPSACRRAATCTARTAATWRCTTTSRSYFAGLVEFLHDLANQP